MPDLENEEISEKLAEPSKSSKGLLIGLLALVLVVGGLAAFFLRRHKPAPKPQLPPVTGVLHLETFVVNLADEESTYLRLGVDVGVAQPGGEKSKEAAMVAVPLVRDTILGVVTALHSEELHSAEGKQKLKERLLQSLQARAPELGIREVYLTEILIQR